MVPTMDDLKRFIGRNVKDSYGKDIGKLIGATSNIKGQISDVSLELYNGDFVSYPSTRLSINGMTLLLLEDWALEADELSGELDLLRRRDHALNELTLSGDMNETMRQQLREQFKQARDELLKKSDVALQKLAERSQQIDEQIKVIQSIMANNKMHYAAREIGEDAYNLSNESIQNGLRHFSFEKKNIEEKINALIACRDSVEDVGTPQPDIEKKQQPEQQVSITSNIGLTKTTGPRDIVIVRMDP